MKSLFVKLLHASFLKYALVGVLGLAIDMGLFYVFYERMHFNYVLANIMSSSLAVVHNYILNAWFTFKVKDQLLIRFLSFYSIALAGMALSSGMLAVVIGALQMNSMLAKAIAVLVVALLQYFVNKKLTFGEKKLFSLMNHLKK